MAHLLLIDDDPALIPEQVRQAFPRHRVDVAATGADGIARAAADPPDVILLDLPGRGGGAGAGGGALAGADPARPVGEQALARGGGGPGEVAGGGAAGEPGPGPLPHRRQGGAGAGGRSGRGLRVTYRLDYGPAARPP